MIRNDDWPGATIDAMQPMDFGLRPSVSRTAARRSLGRFLAAVVVAGGLCRADAVADDWACWRGPHQNGSIEAAGQFAGKSFGLEVLWKKSLGAGYSGVSIAQGKLLATFAEDRSDYLGAFDAESGDELWRYRLGKMYRAHDGGHDGPVSTPISDGQMVITLAPRGTLVAVRLDNGQELWTVDLVKKFGAHVPFWGFTTTPVIAGDVVVVQAGGRSGSAVVALDRHTGEARWNCGDGRVDYRSPVLAAIHGRQHLIVSNHRRTSGVDPATGTELWTWPTPISNDKTPLLVGDSSILLSYGSGTELIRVAPDSDRPESVWRSSELRGNYETPVRHGDCLYGFTNRYLTCVDVTSGKRLWRSRPPGGKGVILVDGHLVIFGAKGDVVVAEANPRGYVEKARLTVSDADGYATPSFADGNIYVRNLQGDLFAVCTVDPVARPTDASTPVNRFDSFLQKLTVADDKKAMLDGFMNSQPSFPVVEDDRWVHFIYRGSATDVGIRGNMIAGGEEDEMLRVEGTDLFHRSYPIEPGARWEYRFTVDFDKSMLDPRNSRTNFDGGLSEVATVGWQQPVFAKNYTGDAPGVLDSFSMDGQQIQVYLPAGYEPEREKRYPLVVVTDGGDWHRIGKMSDILDHLSSSQIESPIVALVPRRRGRDLGGDNTGQYARWLATELVPQLERRYRTRTQPGARTIFGKRGAAVAAAYTALAYPDIYGKCIAISYGRADTVRADMVTERIESAQEGKPEFYVTWNRYEVWRPQSFSCREQSQSLVSQLKEHEFPVTAIEKTDSAGWRSWRIQAGEALIALIGKAKRP